jgi:Cytochrome P460
MFHRFRSLLGKWHFTPAFLAGSTALMLCGAGAPSVEKGTSARFEGKDTLLFPTGYREWVFVGSSLGLEYDAEKKQASEKLEFKNVYMNSSAYREFVRTRIFPEGTILVLETGTEAKKSEPGLRGSYLDEFTGVSAAVKDTKRFAEGWAYFGFGSRGAKSKDRAQPFAKSACYDCHRQNGGLDNVFTQFYPVLRAKPAK